MKEMGATIGILGPGYSERCDAGTLGRASMVETVVNWRDRAQAAVRREAMRRGARGVGGVVVVEVLGADANAEASG